MMTLDFFIGMATGAIWSAIMLSAVFSALTKDERIDALERRAKALERRIVRGLTLHDHYEWSPAMTNQQIADALDNVATGMMAVAVFAFVFGVPSNKMQALLWGVATLFAGASYWRRKA